MADFFYKKHGKGTNVLILFHGFGEDHRVFDELIQYMINEIPALTCYAVDIYFHGKSTREDRKLTKVEWRNDFDRFLQKEGIDRFSLMGFSLGGRFAISTAMSFPERTNLVLLLAPDGIYQSLWYRIANTVPGNSLFKYLMTHPKPFERFLKFWKLTGLVGQAMIKFIETTLHTGEHRQKVYKTWTYFHPLQYTLKEIVNHFNRMEHILYVVLGERDAVIPPKKLMHKLRRLNTLELKVIPAKHHQLVSLSKNYIISILKDRIL